LEPQKVHPTNEFTIIVASLLHIPTTVHPRLSDTSIIQIVAMTVLLKYFTKSVCFIDHFVTGVCSIRVVQRRSLL